MVGKTHAQTKGGSSSSVPGDCGHVGTMPLFFQETENPCDISQFFFNVGKHIGSLTINVTLQKFSRTIWPAGSHLEISGLTILEAWTFLRHLLGCPTLITGLICWQYLGVPPYLPLSLCSCGRDHIFPLPATMLKNIYPHQRPGSRDQSPERESISFLI